MTQLSYIIAEKDDIEYKISNLFSDYYYRYYKKLYSYIFESVKVPNGNRIERIFQKELLKIVNWTDDKQRREYKKFINWCYEKKDIQDTVIQEYINSYIDLSIKIMLYPNKLDSRYLFENDKPKTKYFFYGCLKRIARYFYDNPLKIKSEEYMTRNKISEIITLYLNKYVPYDDIYDKIEEIDLLSAQSGIDKLDNRLDELIPEHKLLVEKNHSEGGDTSDEHITRNENIVILPSEISETEDEPDIEDAENQKQNDDSEEERHVFLKNNKHNGVGDMYLQETKKNNDYFTE